MGISYYNNEMNHKRSEGSQRELNFEKIHDARCFDGTEPEGREISRQELVPIGDGKFTNAEGDIYELATQRDSDLEAGYFLVEKKNISEAERKEVARLKERGSKRSWVDLYRSAVINIEYERKGGLPKPEPLDPMMR